MNETKKKIDGLFNRGLIDRKTRNVLEKSVDVSEDCLRKAVVQIIAALIVEGSQKNEMDSAPEITEKLTLVRLGQVLSKYKFQDTKAVDAKLLIEILEDYLTAFTDEVVYDIGIILTPSTYRMLVSLFNSKPSIFSVVSVRVKSIYAINGLSIPETVKYGLQEICGDYGIELIEDPMEFIEKTKGKAVLIEGCDYSEEAGLKQLICDLIRNGSVIISDQLLEFQGPEADKLDEAVENGLFKASDLVILYQSKSITKFGGRPVSKQLLEYNRRATGMNDLMFFFSGFSRSGI